MKHVLAALLILAAVSRHAVGQEPEPAPPDSPATQTETPPEEPPPAPSRPIPGIRRQPRPQSPEETAAYEAFRAESRTAEQVRLIEDFLLQFPNSEMKEFAYQAAMQAYHAQNDYNRVLTYGELAITENPDNLTVLLTLSTAVAESTNRSDSDWDERLEEGDQHASHALDVLARMRKPPGVPEEPWTRTRNESESTAHAARGLIALIREDFPKAELELKEAVTLASRPDAILLYRLGLCYSFQKKYEESLEALQRAAAQGGVKMTSPEGADRDLVTEALDFVGKVRAGAAHSQGQAPLPGPPVPLAAPQEGAPAEAENQASQGGGAQ